MLATDRVPFLGATVLIQHHRRGPDGELVLLHEQTARNFITKAGRDFAHAQTYAASGIAANGLNWIGLSNDPVTETVDSTTLSAEIVGTGLGRAQGTVAHTAATNRTTVTKVFTATGTITAQKAALFTAVSGGTMNHVIAFDVPRTLSNGDTLTVVFQIDLG